MSSDIDPGVGPDPSSAPKPSGHPGPPRGKAVLEGEADADAIINAIERRRHPRAQELLGDDATAIDAMRKHALPALRLPGFGEPEDDCGEYILPSGYFCPRSGKTIQFKHNCLRYDCPQHAQYAIRRRAAGSSSGSGIGPQLKSLLLRLYHARGEQNHHYQHIFISPQPRGEHAEPFLFRSENPLEAFKDVCRDILDELGAQGAIVYHPFRGGDEDRNGDDRGFWQKILGHYSDWNKVRDKLEYGPHMHCIVVAPYIDVSVTEEVYEKTGWVIHRRTDKSGRSIGRKNKNETDDDAMAGTLTYALSHSPVYDAGDQRRLAAWMKGPDVATTKVYEKVKKTMQACVYKASEDTLGIPSPDMKCDCDFHAKARQVDPTAGVIRSGSVTMDDLHRGPGLHVDGKYRPDQTVRTASDSGVNSGPGGSPTSSSPSTSAPGRVIYGPSNSDRRDVDGAGDQEAGVDVPKCGGRLRHISKAGEYLLSEEWRRNAPYADELEEYYRNYIQYMTSRDLDPLHDRPELPEERDHPPPD